MYGSQISGQASALPVTGVGSAMAMASGGFEGWMLLALAVFTMIAAIRTVGKLMPRFGSGDMR